MDEAAPPEPESNGEGEVDPAHEPEGEQLEPGGPDRQFDDPEMDQLWGMSFGDLEKILHDENHPLHKKATEVSAETFRSLSAAVKDLAGPHGVFESFTKSLTPSMPKVDLAGPRAALKTLAKSASLSVPEFNVTSPRTNNPWVSEIVTDYDKWQSLKQSLPAPERSVLSTVDFDAVKVPEASVTEVARAAELEAQRIRIQQVELLTGLLENAQADAQAGAEALAVAKSGKLAAWWGAWFAGAAAVIGVVSIFVTVLVSE